MNITKQDKRDIEETILYLCEVAGYISMQKDIMDGEPDWKPNVIDSCDVAVERLHRIIKEEKW
mgnify:CR=1 FL=1